MTDDDFVPRPVSAPQRAVPIGPAAGKQAGVQLNEHAKAFAPEPPVNVDPTRSARAKRSWKTRRKHQQDRHVVGEHPFDAALEELYRQRDGINAGIEVLEKLK